MSDNDDLYKRLEGSSDQELIDMIQVNFNDYTEEALSVARKIISKRGSIQKISENIKIQRKKIEKQHTEEFEKSVIIQETLNDIKNNAIKFKPSFIRILFCLAATLFVFAKTVNGIGGLEDNAAVFGRLIAFFVFVYILWGSTFKLYPKSIKKFSIFNNQVYLHNAFGTERDVIAIESVNVHSNDSFLTITGMNKKNKNLSFEISKKKIGYENFDLIKSKLKNKILNEEITENEYECSNCGAGLTEDDEICPKCGEDISEIEDDNERLELNNAEISSYNQMFDAIYDRSYQFEKEVYTEYLLKKAGANKHSFIKRLLSSETRKSHKKAVTLINEKQKQIDKVANAVCIGGAVSVDMASPEQREKAIPVLEEAIKLEPKYEKLRNSLKKLKA